MIGNFYVPTIRGCIDPIVRGCVAPITPIVRGCVTPTSVGACFIPTCNSSIKCVGFEMKMLQVDVS
jgi:hypothetical protein